MANQEHLDLLKQGKDNWNAWRSQHLEVQPDLSGANLRHADLMAANLNEANLSNSNLFQAYLSGTHFSRANLSNSNLIGVDLTVSNLSRADLSGAYLGNAYIVGANLNEANLNEANLIGANLSKANLSRANLSGANLSRANLNEANLNEANLSKANLSRTTLVGTNFTSAKLKGCIIYGISAWDILLDGAEQLNLTITPEDQPTITVDNLKIAQFIYLLLNNQEIHDAINTLTTKAVLILGHFSEKRKPALNAIKEELRNQNLLPILFDFDRPSSQTVREAVRTLAQLSYFIIADLTEQSSIAEELEIIIPQLVVPVKPLLHASQNREFSMFKSYYVHDWLLPIYRYTDISDLLTNLEKQVIEPAKQKALEWTEKKKQIEQG